jgi:type I restriction enzyme S subunit
MIFPRWELPKGWRWIRLGDHVTKVGSGITPRGGQEVYRQSGVPLIRSQNVLMNSFSTDGLAFIPPEIDEAMEHTRVVAGDVLLNITGASIGRVCVAPQELCPANVNQHVSIIRSDGSIHPDFLSFFLASPSLQRFIVDLQAGATRQALTKTMIEDFDIPLPPLAQQKRIARILTQKMAAIEHARAAAQAQIEAAQALPAAYLRAIFNTSEAKQWPRRRLEELAARQKYAIKRGPFGSTLRKEFFVDAGYKVYEQQHAIAGDFSIGRYYITPEKCKELEAFRVQAQDIIISCSGTIGKVGIVPDDAELGIINQALLKVTLDQDIIIPQYFKLVFESDHVRNQLTVLSYGSGLKNVASVRTLKQIEFLLPPVSRQREIVAEYQQQMRQVQELESALGAQLGAITTLPAAYLRQAFNGEL